MGGNKDSTSSIILHSNWASSCVYRVRICLSLKDLPYEVKPINFGDLLKPGADDELNPMRFVPVLEIDGHKLIESMAILNYVEETRPQPPLLPQDPFKRAQVRAICDIIVSGKNTKQSTLENNLSIKLICVRNSTVAKHSTIKIRKWIHEWREDRWVDSILFLKRLPGNRKIACYQCWAILRWRSNNIRRLLSRSHGSQCTKVNNFQPFKRRKLFRSF